MHVKSTRHLGRAAWELDNGILMVVMLAGGGHIARLALASQPDLNPLWTPPWPTVEPWQFRRADADRCGGSPLLASVSGHLLCLHYFGSPSAAESQRGLDGHGEAPRARWELAERAVSPRHARLRTRCELPVAGMQVARAITLRPGSHVVEVTEEITNTTDHDTPFTLCEHVTFGPPFLEKGVTCFDLPADAGHTFPRDFGTPQRLRTDTAFDWPDGPGAAGGTVDLRTIGKRTRRSSDFTTQHLDAEREDAWFSAVNPRAGLLVAYQWRRRDFPWVGNWEENFCRTAAPWNGRTLARGMEFANTPFPTSLQEQVARGRMHGDATFAWLPARATLRVDYRILLMPVEKNVRGVADIRPAPTGLAVDLLV